MINIGYTEIRQTCPTTWNNWQTLSFAVALKTRTASSLTLTFTLSARMCIAALVVNVALINHPLIDAGISFANFAGSSKSIVT